MNSHADVLKRLSPVPLGPNYEADCDEEGKYLDIADARISDLAAEIFADTAFETLPFWERLLGIPTSESTNIETRKKDILIQMRATGGLSRAYFIELAAILGFEGVSIFEPHPFQTGLNTAGDRLYADEAIFCWRVDGVEIPAGTYFTAGVSAAGDCLCAFPVESIQTIFNQLKPAHTTVYFEEPED